MSTADQKVNSSASSSSVILLDIEGTTTSISFVKDVLFPFARKELETFLNDNWDDAEVQSIIQMIVKQSDDDVNDGLLENGISKSQDKTVKLPEIIKNLTWQMDKDRKTTGLKALQGKIWKRGFEMGILKGHIYEDVPTAFERWTSSGKKIYIYSSGSVEAQILLFKYSQAGDLTKFLSGHFDTTTGPKMEANSYKTISEKIGVSSSDILFCTDVSKEAYAAKEAGLQVIVSIRSGNAPLTEQELNDFSIIHDFNKL